MDWRLNYVVAFSIVIKILISWLYWQMGSTLKSADMGQKALDSDDIFYERNDPNTLSICRVANLASYIRCGYWHFRFLEIIPASPFIRTIQITSILKWKNMWKNFEKLVHFLQISVIWQFFSANGLSEKTKFVRKVQFNNIHFFCQI